MLKKITLIYGLVCSFWFSAYTHAQAPVADNTSAKLAFIQQSLDDEYTHSYLWQNGWTLLYTASIAMEFVGWRKENPGTAKKYDHGVGLITSTLALSGMFTEPMLTHRYATKLEEMPEASDAEKAQKLKMAEKWLEEAAARERHERSWAPQIGSIIVSALAGGAIALDDNRPKDGLISFAVSMLWTEIKVLSSPNNLTDALEKYRTNRLTKTYQTPSYWQLSAVGTNLSLSYHF